MSTVDKETAENDFERFADIWGLLTDERAMGEDDLESFNKQKSSIMAQIMAGNATVDDEGNMVYTLRQSQGDTEEVTFSVPTGASYLAMDRHKAGKDMHKLYSFMGDSTGVNPKTFSKLKGRDIKFCMGVTLLFLGS